MTKYLEIGQIVNTFGIKGMVKVKPFTDDINKFSKLEKVIIQTNQNVKTRRNRNTRTSRKLKK